MNNPRVPTVGARIIRSNAVISNQQSGRLLDDREQLPSFSYNQIPSNTHTENFKNAKKLMLENDEAQIETHIDDFSSKPRVNGNKSIEELYDETSVRGINDEEVTVRRPYRFVKEDSWNAACRKDVIRRLRNRFRATDFAGNGVSVGCCYPCFKPLDQQIIEEMS